MAEENVIDDDVLIIEEDIEDDVLIIEEDIENDVAIIEENIEDDAMEIDNLDESDEGESEEEIEPLADSDYVSDSDETLRQKKCRHLSAMDIINLDITTKMCRIKYYYYDAEEKRKYCSDCFLRLAPMFRNAISVRKHKTDYCALLLGSNCKECKKNLEQIVPRNMCLICTN